MDLKNVDKTKLGKNCVILGILCVALFAPVLGWALDKWPLFMQDGVTIKESSDSDINDAHATHFTLGYNQKVTINFNGIYPNVTSTLIIVTKLDYDTACDANAAPGGVSTRDFIYNTGYPGSGGSTYGSNDFRTISYATVSTQDWVIEFMGDVVGSRLESVPGDYVIVVYGTTVSSDSDDVKFNLTVKIDSIGEDLEYWVSIAGWVLLGLGVLALLSAYLKNRRGP